MALVFDGTTYLKTSTVPAFSLPFCLGFWFRSRTGSLAEQLVSWSVAASATVRYNVTKGNSALPATVVVGHRIGAANGAAIITGAIVSNVWLFVLARFISTTNRRNASIIADTYFTEVQNTTNISAVTPDNGTIGTTITSGAANNIAAAGSSLAEYWLTDADICANETTDRSLVQQLALNGPFSVPHIAASVIDYRSFQSGISDDVVPMGAGRYQAGKGTVINFLQTGGTGLSIGPHPPLSSEYVRPAQRKLFRAF
jgi:hypothetical protein